MDWVINTYHIVSSVLLMNVEHLIQSTTFIMNELLTVNVNSIATTAFLTYIDVKTTLAKWGTYMYDNSAIIKNTVDITSYNIQWVLARYNKHRIEPFHTNWVCLSVLFANKTDYFSGNTYVYLENYQYIKPHMSDDTSKIQHFNNCLHHLTETAKSMSMGDNITETMVTLKVGDIFFNKTYKKDFIMNSEEQQYSNTQSKVSFLTIDYTHPDMPGKIVINIPKTAYTINNIILSSLFIKRYLEYQPDEYIFDDKYTLKLMDNNIKMLSLKFNDFILIKEKTYEVIRNE